MFPGDCYNYLIFVGNPHFHRSIRFNPKKDKVVSGFKNKLQTSMGNITPDTALAEQIKKQQEPVDKK